MIQTNVELQSIYPNLRDLKREDDPNKCRVLCRRIYYAKRSSATTHQTYNNTSECGKCVSNCQNFVVAKGDGFMSTPRWYQPSVIYFRWAAHKRGRLNSPKYPISFISMNRLNFAVNCLDSWTVCIECILAYTRLKALFRDMGNFVSGPLKWIKISAGCYICGNAYEESALTPP